MIRQCVILCGGLGTRLGDLTRARPKPVLPVDGQPFLDVLLWELGRQGFREILLLASFEAEQIEQFARTSASAERFGMRVDVAIEAHRGGTGGALWQARDRLDPAFFLLNGDSWLDTPLRPLEALLNADETLAGAINLRPVPDGRRYGVVEVEGSRIRRFETGSQAEGPALINGGVYAFRKQALLDRLTEDCSLERYALPGLAAEGRLAGRVSSDYFIDIGVPETYAQAQIEVPAHLRRPAIFFDRDGVLNVDHGHVGEWERFEWQPHAREAIRAANEAGYFTFIVTNQAGVARGKYDEADFHALMQHIREDLAEIGGHIDDYRHCPHHPEAPLEAYRRSCDWRKPGPGMLRDLIAHWPLRLEQSFLVGDQPTDIEAAKAAGIPGFLFGGSDLLRFLIECTPFANSTKGSE